MISPEDLTKAQSEVSDEELEVAAGGAGVACQQSCGAWSINSVRAFACM